MTTGSQVERVSQLVTVLLAQHPRGHKEGCIQLLSGAGTKIRCDCGYEATLTDLATTTSQLLTLYRQRAQRREGRGQRRKEARAR